MPESVWVGSQMHAFCSVLLLCDDDDDDDV